MTRETGARAAHGTARDQSPIAVKECRQARALESAGRWRDAAEAYRRALKASPAGWPALRGLIHALGRSGQLAEAPAWIEHWQRLPDRAGEVLIASGMVALESRQAAEALPYLREAAALLPASLDAHFYRGVAALGTGNDEEAEVSFRAALAIDPAHTSSLNNLANALFNRGRHEQAVEILEQALRQGSADVLLLNTLALAYCEQRRFVDAERLLRQLVAARGDFAEGWSNLAMVLLDTERAAEAVSVARQAVSLHPNHPESWYNLGLALAHVGRMAEAATAQRTAIGLAPDFTAAHHNLALAALSCGAFEEGWREHQWRDARQGFEKAGPGWRPATPPLPEALDGLRISLLGEQGIGDELFFLRFVPQLKARGAKVIYRPTVPKLDSLLRRLPFLDHVLDPGQPVEQGCVYQTLAGDLPHILGMRGAHEAPAPVALAPDPARIANFMLQWLGELTPPYIGLCWRAGASRAGVRRGRNVYNLLHKEVPLDQLAESLRGIEASFVVLQRNPEHGEIRYLSEKLGRSVLDCSDLNDDIEEMLAVLAVLDDMIGVSNTNYHLRAGLGKGGRVLVPVHPEYRWMDTGRESPWFPGFSVYRETSASGWKNALAELRNDLNR